MQLEFGSAQLVILGTFGVLAVSLACAFVVVARRGSREEAFEEVRASGYRLRRTWLVFLAALLAAGLSASAFFLPYASGDPGATEVRVVGGQFYWSLSPETFRAGDEVVFDVTSADVNHGFGLYDPAGTLIGSVQAMPGYHNRLAVTLERAGTYTIACFEYCGLDHHGMIRELTVRP
jgi:cytochrome c oxidase subunit 2